MKNILFGLLLVFLVACTPAQPKQMMGETSEQKAMEKEAMEKGEWTPEQIAQMEKDEAMEKEGMADEQMQKEMAETMEPGLIGGDVSKYYDWDKAKFDQAVADGKTILIDFAANWCGTCQKEELHYKAAFAELDDPNIIGFKVHYKDDQTTSEHEALAQQYQIAYQHTKVVLKNGQVVKKSPEAWEKDRIIKELKSV